MSGTIGTITQTVVGTTEVHRVELGIVAGSLNVYGDGASSIGDIDGLQDALDDKQPLDAVLTATTASFTVELNDKLDGVEPGAQVNADPDWDDVQNKPSTFASTIALVSGLQTVLDLKVSSSTLGVTVATLVAGTVPADQLPSYVDDVLEFANLAAFPATGATGKIYVALDTNKTYRWSGSAYVYITSGAVDSVAGRTGVVVLTKADVGLSNVDNTADLSKPISTLTQSALDGKQASLGYTPYNATNPAGYTSNAGTVTAVTVAAANGFSASVASQGTTPALTISQQDATASQAGKLSAADWATFNAKAVAPYLKNIVLWTHSTATNGNMLGSTLTGNGSFGPGIPTAAGSIWAGMARSLYGNVVTTTNQVLGVRTGESIFHIGSVAGKGGFTYRARFGMEIWNNAGRFFAGICAGTSLVVTANPSTNNNSCGFCVDDNDSGLISFVTRNGTTTTKTSTGKTMASGAAFDIEIIVAPNGTTAAWSIREINTLANTAATGTASATLPDNTTMMGACVLASNAALTTATAVQIGVVTIYVQTDY